MAPHEVLAFNVDRLAALRGLNRGDVAKRSGINASQLSGYLTGRRDPPFSQIFLIAKGLDCSPAEFLLRPGEVLDHDLEVCARRLLDLAVKHVDGD